MFSPHEPRCVLVKSRGAKSQNSISATYQGVLVVRVWGRTWECPQSFTSTCSPPQIMQKGYVPLAGLTTCRHRLPHAATGSSLILGERHILPLSTPASNQEPERCCAEGYVVDMTIHITK